MKLILHVGFHKTGTSAIQAFCIKNQDKLAQHRFLYPRAGASKPQFLSTPTSESGHRLLSDVLVSPTNLKSAEKLDTIIAEASGYREINTVIISSETFSAPKIKISSALEKTLKKYFSEITILAYLRRQDVWAETFYKEVLCWNGRKEKRAFQKFSDEFLVDWLDYEARLEMWEQVFGRENMTVKSYDDREDKNIIIDFFKTIGFPGIEDFEFPGVINPSLPNDLVPLLRGANNRNLTREQKSRLTNRIFEELAKSDYKVEKQQLIPTELLEKYIAEYSLQNVRICERFAVDPCDVFCFGKDKYQTARNSAETSLPEEIVNSLKEQILQFNNDTLAKTKFSHDRTDRGRVGVSCLLNESPSQTEIFVKYHLELGVSRIRLYLDNPNDPMAGFDFGTGRVEVVKCDAAFWQEKLGREPYNNGEKLSVCHRDGLNYLCRLNDIDWVINLDADELLYVSRGETLQAYLRRLPKTVDQLTIMPLEGIFVSKDDSKLFAAEYFKIPRLARANELPAGKGLRDKIMHRLVHRLERSRRPWLARYMLLKLPGYECVFLSWAKADEDLYKKHMPLLSQVMRNGFLAHSEGRTFTRHGIELDDVTSHIPRQSGKKLRIRRRNNTVFVLHYDAVDFSAWHLKWHRRIYGSTTATAINEKRKMQQEMFRHAYEAGEDQLKDLFRNLYVFPEDAITDFLRSGLIVKLDQPLLARVKNGINPG